jgi:hypothetical protein
MSFGTPVFLSSIRADGDVSKLRAEASILAITIIADRPFFKIPTTSLLLIAGVGTKNKPVRTEMRSIDSKEVSNTDSH